MLDNMQQEEREASGWYLKGRKKWVQEVVEMKERKRALDKCWCPHRTPGQNRKEKNPAIGRAICHAWNKWNAKPSGELKSSFRGIKAGTVAVRHSGENSRRKSGGSPRAKDRKNKKIMERRIRGEVRGAPWVGDELQEQKRESNRGCG